MLAAALTALALAGTASSVPVSGGTDAQRAIVSRALTEADPGSISSARIDARHYLVLAVPARTTPRVRHARAIWEAELAAQAAADTLAASGRGVAGYEVASLLVPYHGPSRPPVLNVAGLGRLHAEVLRRAGAAGVALRSARVVRIGSGALDVVVRLRESQLLDDRAAAALTTLAGPGEQHFLDVEAPDGTALAYGGTFGNAGSWNYGGDTGTTRVPRPVPERLWRPHTDLVVQVSGHLGTRRTRTFHIVCGGAVPAPGSRCRRVLADRWALLVPTVSAICAGDIAGAWSVSVRGTFAGRPVSRDYGGCYSATGDRWARFLRLAR
jgi:hypothetical protein